MSHRTVLIIEDDEATRQSFADTLQLKGYRPLVAANGVEALRILNSELELPCVAILDLMMPGMSGWDFLDHQRSDERLAKLPVIVCSSYSASAKSVCTAGYIAKPVHPQALWDAIRGYCEVPPSPSL